MGRFGSLGLVSDEPVEVLASDQPILIRISIFEHLLDLLILDVHPEVSDRIFQVVNVELPRVLNVEGGEDDIRLIQAEIVVQSIGGQSTELTEVDFAAIKGTHIV